jgi:hypothetical protein
MKKLLVMLLAGLAPLAVPTPGQAEISLSLSSPDDVNHLTVGQTVTINVDLSGVTDSTKNLSYLAATVQFDSTLLGSPSTAMAGAIVPDANNFVPTSGLSNEADGFYDAVFNTPPLPPSAPISTNGTFYSFTVTTLKPGDGTISFVPGASAYTFADDPTQTVQFNPLTSSLNFHIEGPAVAVPEPGSHILLLSGALTVGAVLARRRLGRGPRTGSRVPDPADH